MLQPVHTPLPGDDKVSGLWLHLETAAAPSLTLIPLAVRDLDRTVRAVVIVRLGDGGRESLSPDEARLLAKCLRADPFPGAFDLGDALDQAALEAEARRIATLVGEGGARAAQPDPQVIGGA